MLFDYKGGAAFSSCERLPHTTAVITDLDDRLAHRALRSLTAELRRRERLFAAAGTAELADYRAGPHQAEHPLGRLVLVVDEFAALAEEQPEMLGGLVAIAARGRSLGIHLILATQRPTGVVSGEILANLALRIALRVIDPAESLALVGSAAPAAIDKARPGRAFVRTGSTVREFQTARVGVAARAGRDEVRVDFLDEWGRAVADAAPPAPAGPRVVPASATGLSDIDLLVDSMRAAAGAASPDNRARPWLPALDTSLPIDSIAVPPTSAVVAFGMVDLPDDQRQDPLVVDIGHGGSILIAGPAGSGRSSALRTLAAAAARRNGCAQLQMYVIDCASRGLDPIASLPQTAAALGNDPETIARLLQRLGEQVSLRCTDPDALGGRTRPALVLLIDGWENLVDSLDGYDSGASSELLQILLRDAPSAQLTIAITGGAREPAPACTRLGRHHLPAGRRLARPGRAGRIATGTSAASGPRSGDRQPATGRARGARPGRQ